MPKTERTLREHLEKHGCYPPKNERVSDSVQSAGWVSCPDCSDRMPEEFLAEHECGD